MMTRVWAGKGYDKNVRVEEHEYRDGTKHYTLIDRLGRPCNVNSEVEAMRIVKRWGMEEATEQFKAAGWIA